MELKILSNNENTFLKRKEIKFLVEQEASTASRAELAKEICKKLNLNPESTIVVKVDQGFGHKESTGVAHSYQNKEMLEKTEPKHILARASKKAAKRETNKEQQKDGEAAQNATEQK